jgi:hypothetical protein
LARCALIAILSIQETRILRVRIGSKIPDYLFAAALACPMVLTLFDAVLAGCKPDHSRAAFFINSMGACSFDAETLNFAGSPVQQALCLMRGMDQTRNLAPPVPSLPPALAERIGQAVTLPSRAVLADYLSALGLEGEFGDFLWLPVSHAYDNRLEAPMARYFVIHDTSGPNFGRRSFPDDIDGGGKVNDLRNFDCPDGWGKAHVVINRTGQLLLAHDYSIPWRETKFEQAAEFGGALKGLFLHNEMIQPRRSAPGRGRRNDARSPDPAFTPAQYDRLALLYVIASVRAEQWLIPAFHSAIDAQIANGHDDPLNFDIDSFARSLDSLAAKLGTPDQVQAAHH